MHPHADHQGATTEPGTRRAGALPGWVIAAIGVHFLLATVVHAGDLSAATPERTKVRRISESVVQVIRELVERQPAQLRTEPRAPGYRVIESGEETVMVVMPPAVRMLDALLTDLPPPTAG